MRNTQAGLVALVLMWGSATALTGCSLIPSGDPVVVDSDPTADADPDSRRGRDEEIECDGRDTTVADSDGDYRFRGVCPTIIIEGTELEIEVIEAQVGTIIVRGDRNEIEAGDLTTLEINGQGNDVEAESLGSLSVAGDRNAVDVDGILGSVVVDGNENDVESLELGDVQDNGDRNEIRTD